MHAGSPTSAVSGPRRPSATMATDAVVPGHRPPSAAPSSGSSAPRRTSSAASGALDAKFRGKPCRAGEFGPLARTSWSALTTTTRNVGPSTYAAPMEHEESNERLFAGQAASAAHLTATYPFGYTKHA